MVKDQLDKEKMTIQSIPLVLVKSISIFRNPKKQLMKITRRRMIIHFKDGSVKYIGAP